MSHEQQIDLMAVSDYERTQLLAVTCSKEPASSTLPATTAVGHSPR
jgi:hypothetical protein